MIHNNRKHPRLYRDDGVSKLRIVFEGSSKSFFANTNIHRRAKTPLLEWALDLSKALNSALSVAKSSSWNAFENLLTTASRWSVSNKYFDRALKISTNDRSVGRKS